LKAQTRLLPFHKNTVPTSYAYAPNPTSTAVSDACRRFSYHVRRRWKYSKLVSWRRVPAGLNKFRSRPELVVHSQLWPPAAMNPYAKRLD